MWKIGKDKDKLINSVEKYQSRHYNYIENTSIEEWKVVYIVTGWPIFYRFIFIL